MNQQDSRKRYLGFHREIDNFMDMHPHMITWYILKGYLEPTVSDTDIDSIDLELTNTGDAWLYHSIPSAPDTAPTADATAGDTDASKYTARTSALGIDIINIQNGNTVLRLRSEGYADYLVQSWNSGQTAMSEEMWRAVTLQQPVPSAPDSGAGYTITGNYPEIRLQRPDGTIVNFSPGYIKSEWVALLNVETSTLRNQLTSAQGRIAGLDVERDASDKLLAESATSIAKLTAENNRLADAILKAKDAAEDPLNSPSTRIQRVYEILDVFED